MFVICKVHACDGFWRETSRKPYPRAYSNWSPDAYRTHNKNKNQWEKQSAILGQQTTTTLSCFVWFDLRFGRHAKYSWWWMFYIMYITFKMYMYASYLFSYFGTFAGLSGFEPMRQTVFVIRQSFVGFCLNFTCYSIVKSVMGYRECEM